MAVHRKDIKKQHLKIQKIYSFPEISFLHKIFLMIASVGWHKKGIEKETCKLEENFIKSRSDIELS